MENDGFRGGDVLVPSDYDETGGVAKVDVSIFFFLCTPNSAYKFTSHLQSMILLPAPTYTGNYHQLVGGCSNQGSSNGYHWHSSKQGTICRVEPVVIQKIREKWQ